MLPPMSQCKTVDFKTAAEASIRAYCGWHVAPVLTETVIVSPRHRSPDLYLPTTHLVNVEKVELLSRPTGEWIELEPDVYEWDEIGLLRRHGCWPCRLRSVRVTMTHGYEPEEVPDVLAIVDAIEKRSRMNLGGVASQSVNGASVSYQTAGGAPLSVPLLQIEKQALAPYKLGLGRIPG